MVKYWISQTIKNAVANLTVEYSVNLVIYLNDYTIKKISKN